MRSLITVMTACLLCACGDQEDGSAPSPDVSNEPNKNRVIRYRFDGEKKTEVLLTDFGGIANKTVTVEGKDKTSSVDIDEFNYLWDARTEIAVIKESQLGEDFTGIDTETHHIVTYIGVESEESGVMHAVLHTNATPEFDEWLTRLMK